MQRLHPIRQHLERDPLSHSLERERQLRQLLTSGQKRLQPLCRIRQRKPLINITNKQIQHFNLIKQTMQQVDVVDEVRHQLVVLQRADRQAGGFGGAEDALELGGLQRLLAEGLDGVFFPALPEDGVVEGVRVYEVDAVGVGDGR